ncbi:MAG: LysE family translocator [Candidatus Schekmanbacteria bacterium]|nr:LysE family translocator [Candidatus Schekmanbacteria bacterium]
MLAIENYPSFLSAIILFQVVPGPGTLAIVSATARHGRRGGLGAVAGTLSADLVYMIAAVVGLAAVLQANPLLLRGVQWAGAAYLCWIGAQMLCASENGGVVSAGPMAGRWSSYRRALAVGLTNPKVVLFFVAFFPLFLRPGAAIGTLGVMMAHVTVISAAYQVGLVVAGNAVARRVGARPVVGWLARRAAGGGIIAFGLKLAMDNR